MNLYDVVCIIIIILQLSFTAFNGFIPFKMYQNVVLNITKFHDKRYDYSEYNINCINFIHSIFGPFSITTEIFGGGLVCRKK